MGMLIYGRLLEPSDECVAYEFAQNQHGVWDDVEPDPVAAHIVFKALRAFEQDGSGQPASPGHPDRLRARAV